MTQGTSAGAIYYTVTADTQQLLDSVTPVDKSLDGLNKTFARTDKAANQAQFQMTKTATAVKGLGAESTATRASVSGLYGALAGLMSLRAAQGLIEMADAYGEMAERIAMATSSQAEYEHVQQRLLATANGTYRSLSEAQELYVLTASTLKSLGYDTDQSMDIVDSLSYAFVKNATAADRASTTIDAVTKALNKGKVEADGWQSILAAVPTIVDDLAASTGRSTAEILALGAQGKITGRELSEALRQSLDENKKAADGMATTVKDAFTNLKNNLSVFVGEANRASGATQLMSGALVALGNNIDTVVSLLMVAGAGALARYIAQLGASAIASGRAMLAARAQAAEELRLAQAHMAATQAALAEATATSGLTAAHGRAAAAATAHAAAVARMQAAQAAAVTVGSRLLGLLGGPVGIIALLASAAVSVMTFGSDSKSASGKVDALSGSVDGLTASLKQLSNAGLSSAAANVQERIGESARLAIDAQDKLKDLQAQLAKEAPGSAAAAQITAQMSNWGTVYGEAQKNLDKLRDRAKEIQDLQGRRAEAANGPATPSETSEGQKYLDNLAKQNALLRVQGEERVRLKVAQDLQGKATDEEIAKAQQAAVEQYRLSEAQKERTSSGKEATKATSEDAKIVAALATELLGGAQATRDMAQAAAEASLSKFATPEQIAAVREMAGALWDVNQAKKDQAAINSVDPVAAETERYAAQVKAFQDMLDQKRVSQEEFDAYMVALKIAHDEAMGELYTENWAVQGELETARYEANLAALTEALMNEEIAYEDYYARLMALQADHAEKAEKIDKAKNASMLKTSADAFGAILSVTQAFSGQQSGILKAMFAVSKAFSLAQAAVSIQRGIAEAWGLPFPANLAAVAKVVAGTAPILSNINSVSFGGGREHGGPVAASSMYRINETGAPEILNLANGRQYMLPNSRGEVVSNRDATRQAGGAGQGSGTTIINNLTFSPVIQSSLPVSDKDVRELVSRFNDALKDGMVLRTK